MGTISGFLPKWLLVNFSAVVWLVNLLLETRNRVMAVMNRPSDVQVEMKVAELLVAWSQEGAAFRFPVDTDPGNCVVCRSSICL